MRKDYTKLIFVSVIFVIILIGIFFHKNKKSKEPLTDIRPQSPNVGGGCTAGCTAAGGACQVAAAVNFWDEPEAGLACTAIAGTCMEACKK
jgi:hypothetical protein